MIGMSKRRLRRENRDLRIRLGAASSEIDRAAARLDEVSERLESAGLAVRRPEQLNASFIVSFWASIFGVLSQISVFSLVRMVFPATRRNYAFVDAWVLGNLGLCLVSFFVVRPRFLGPCEAVLIGYGCFRIVEIFVYQLDVLLFGEHRSVRAGGGYALWSSRRTVIHVLHNYIEVIVWFATLYHAAVEWFEAPLSRLESLRLSFFSMTSFGSSDASSISDLADSVLLTESAIGLFAALLMIGRFLALLPAPRMISDFE